MAKADYPNPSVQLTGARSRTGMGQVKARRIRPPQIVQPHPSRRIALMLLVLAVALIGWALLVFDLPRRLEVEPVDLPKLKQERTQIDEETLVLEQRLQALRQDHRQELDTARALQSRLEQLQEDNARLRSQLDFLTELLGGDDGPIEISDLALSAMEDDGVRYWFKVSRTDADETLINGQVHLEVRGQQQGETRYFGLADLTEDQRSGHRLGFRHFQEIDGTMRLPPDFEPQELLVIVVPEDPSITAGARRQFNWPLQMEDN